MIKIWKIKWFWRSLCLSKWHIFTKLVNFLFIKLQQKIIKPSYVIGYPYWLTIDTGNICNLKCALCPTGQRKQGRAQGMMSFDNFRRIIDELARYLIIVDLFNWGEPFLNKDIFEMIHYARKKGVIVHISSNLNYFNETMAEELVKSNCDLLIVSLHGASQESCSKYQNGTNFDRVMDNVRTIVEKRRQKRRKLPFIQWRFLVNKYNDHEIPKAEEIARERVDMLELAALRCDMAEELFMDNQSQFENVREWLPKDEKWSIYDYRHKAKKRLRKNSCSFLYSQSVINWNGSVSPCCGLWYERHDFGNMFESNFKNIWNNKSYRASRQLIFKGKECDAKTICNICKRNAAIL